METTQCRGCPATQDISRRGWCDKCRSTKAKESGKRGGENRRRTYDQVKEASPKKCHGCQATDNISRRGWCDECRADKAKKSGKNGGKSHRCSWFLPPSRQAKARRMAVRAGPAVAPPEHIEDMEVDKRAYLELLNHLDSSSTQVRRATECIDVQVVARWARRTLSSQGVRSVLLGLIVAAHFNCVRTFGMVQHLMTERVPLDWESFHAQLVRCAELWGDVARKRWAIYSPSCMSGIGLPAVAGDYLARFPSHFRAVREHASFEAVASLLEKRVRDAAQGTMLRQELERLRRVVPGMLGDYHFKMLLDFLVASHLYPPSVMSRYPVAKSAGTALGLKKIFPKATLTTPARLSAALDAVTIQIANDARTWDGRHDHPGIIGAALCWLHRQTTGRYERVLAQWDVELDQLQQAGVQPFWR
jgi:hypothetical protein